MIIDQNQVKDTLTLTLTGRLDTTTAPQLETIVSTIPNEVKVLVFDLKGLDYTSSAGLRIFLAAQKKMAAIGTMTVKNVSKTVMEIFEMTGFNDILEIEK